MFYNVVQSLNFTFQMMLCTDMSALLHKLEFTITNLKITVTETTNKLFV